MLAELLTRTFYGNTVGQWLLAIAIVIGSLVVARALYWVCTKVVRRLTARTKTKLDDVLVDQLEEPLVLGVVLFGIWSAIETLTVTDTASAVLHKGILVAAILAAAWLVVRLLNALVEQYVVPMVERTETDFDDQLLPLVRRAVSAGVWLLAAILALDNAGFDIMSILAGLGIGGLAFALAAQDTVANFFGGITIFVDKPFKVGDRIQVRGYDGVVTDIGFRSTRLRTRYEGRTVTIPNALVVGGDVVNVDSEDGRQTFAVYHLSPEHSADDVERAMAILRQIAEDDPDTKDRVYTGFIRITEYSREVMLLYWVLDEASNVTTRTRINLAILRRFAAEDIRLVQSTPIHAKVRELED